MSELMGLPRGTPDLIEQDHRNIRSGVNMSLGFKRFRNAAAVIACIELAFRVQGLNLRRAPLST